MFRVVTNYNAQYLALVCCEICSVIARPAAAAGTEGRLKKRTQPDSLELLFLSRGHHSVATLVLRNYTVVISWLLSDPA